MWSLTEEKIDELIKQMNAKKQEHDTLQKRHPFDLWNEDLDAFLIALDKYEEQEEKDRLAGGGIKDEGKRKRKKAQPKDKVKEIMQPKLIKENNSTASETAAVAKQPIKPKELKPKVDPMDLPLRERLALQAKTNSGLLEEVKTNVPIEGKRTLKQANLAQELTRMQADVDLKRKKGDEEIKASKAKPRQRRVVLESDSDESSEFSMADDSEY